ncbi:hypothetical protein KC951_03525 [Candidatus Saccharibacteria bacterium]|nr:hypothetical protein [Candidatus Saccharibacteria bacterium]
MSEREPINLPPEASQLAGTVRAFDTIDSLEDYESLLTHYYLPDLYDYGYQRAAVAVWEGRPPLGDMVRPPKFYGRIGNVVVAHIEDPFTELVTTRKRYKTTLEPNEEWYREHIIGMSVAAELHSTGRGTIGSLSTLIWLYPRISLDTAVNNGAYHRVLEKPKQVSQSVIEVIENSSAIARQNIAQAIQHPYSGAFETRR